MFQIKIIPTIKTNKKNSFTTMEFFLIMKKKERNSKIPINILSYSMIKVKLVSKYQK